MLILYAKSCNHLSIANQAIGTARISAMITSFKKSFESRPMRLLTDAPNTLRMPISFTRCWCSKCGKAKQSKAGDDDPKYNKTDKHFLKPAFGLIKACIGLIQKLYSNGLSAENFFHVFSNCARLCLILSVDNLIVKLATRSGDIYEGKGFYLVAKRSEMKILCDSNYSNIVHRITIIAPKNLLANDRFGDTEILDRRFI